MEANIPTDNTPVPPQATLPAPPPAAVVVTQGGSNEREAKLEAELNAEKEARKKAEVEAAHALDENKRLKEIPKADPKEKPAKRKNKIRWTHFHSDEDED